MSRTEHSSVERNGAVPPNAPAHVKKALHELAEAHKLAKRANRRYRDARDRVLELAYDKGK